jgi:hypothetical protein
VRSRPATDPVSPVAGPAPYWDISGTGLLSNPTSATVNISYVQVVYFNSADNAIINDRVGFPIGPAHTDAVLVLPPRASYTFSYQLLGLSYSTQPAGADVLYLGYVWVNCS